MAEPQIDEAKTYLVKGKNYKKLWRRWVKGDGRTILATRDADGNTTLSLAGDTINAWMVINGGLGKYELQAKLKEIAE